MSLGQVIALVADLQRSIDQQMTQITEFQRNNRDNIALVTQELQGSRRGHDKRMTAQLTRVEDSLSRSATSLRQASQALARIQLV
ncbi:hypothetical protein [Granulicoccus sp. GXG6511]|uniref:hypothetical protein n=1 Tax=Granulicoccus sp. GXG6511 TaxID=3381351 RepID=UPI003D7EEAE8